MLKLICITAIIGALIMGYLFYLRSTYPTKGEEQIVERNKKVRYKIAIWIAVFISILILCILVLPVGFYVDYLGSNSFSDQKSDWGTFGDFIGGLLNPILSLFTLIFTVIIAVTLQQLDKKNKAEELKKNVQPELVTDLQKVFYCNSYMREDVPLPNLFSYDDFEKLPAETQPKYKQFYIPIYNIGHRTAKNVIFNFTLDFESTITTLKSLNENNRHEGQFSFTEAPNKKVFGMLEFQNQFLSESYFLVKDNPQSISHIVNSEVNAHPYHLAIPSEFLDLYKLYFFLYYWQKKGHFKNLSFPSINLSISFQDIYGNNYANNFQLKLEYGMGSAQTTHFLTCSAL